MVTAQVDVTLERGRRQWQVKGTRVAFNVHRCFETADEAARDLLRTLADHVRGKPGLALWDGPLLAPLLDLAPDLRGIAKGVIAGGSAPAGDAIAGLPALDPEALPDGVRTVLICETRAVERMLAADAVPEEVEAIDASVLGDIATGAIPPRAWTPLPKNIYPIKVPRVRFSGTTDMILMDCPARNLSLMPNGLAYVHNALKKAGVNFETFDLDIVTYHRYHIRRLYDEGGRIVMPSGREMPTDPWQAENYDLWEDAELLAYLSPIIDEAARAVIRARPKILGLSIQQCSEKFSRLLVNQVRAALPDIVILVGGFSCYNPDIGLRAFPEADYMCIGESDLTVGPLVRQLAAGKRPKDVPGVVSRHDTPDRMFVPAPMQHNLDQLDFPRYEWADLSLYRNHNAYQLVPVIASRGCRWSRCTFCAERFYWRIRSARNFVDEVEWLVDRGCTLFMFNESDLNGMPDKLLEICDELIRRDIKVRLTGQLRVQKTSDRAFFDKLHRAGFVSLRFGIDAFSENTLRLQKKGYTVDMVRQNLKDCWEAGIYTEINWVIGVPGETDADCDEGVNLILETQKYIGRLANINPLILINGSVYWIDPEAHGIRFRTSKEELYASNPRYVPSDAWYSVEPYIDAQVRKERFERIVVRLYESGFKLGAWAERLVADVKSADRRARAGGVYRPEHAEADDRPALIHTLPTHKVYRFKGRYYALPEALAHVDIATADLDALPGVLSGEDDTALLVEIEQARAWANSRGRFDAQQAQREDGTLFRAGSLLGDEGAPAPLAAGPVVVRLGPDFIAIDRDRLGTISPAAWAYRRLSRAVVPFVKRRVLPVIQPRRRNIAPWRKASAPPAAVVDAFAATGIARAGDWRTPDRQPIPGTSIAAVRAVTRKAKPTVLTTMGGYDLIEFDGRFYGFPHGAGADPRAPDLAAGTGVLVADLARDLVAMVRARGGIARARGATAAEKGSGPAGGAATVQRSLGSIGDYDIVAFEGFVYGLPKALGPIDLAVTDVFGIEGVIRDVSQQVVENEIRDLIATRQQAAE